MEQLKRQHQQFAQRIALGDTNTEAYIFAYPNVKSKGVACTNANRLLRNAQIAAAVQDLKQKTQQIVVKKVVEAAADKDSVELLTFVRKRQILSEIANDPHCKKRDRIHAIEMDNRMTGDFAADRRDSKEGDGAGGNTTNINQAIILSDDRFSKIINKLNNGQTGAVPGE